MEILVVEDEASIADFLVRGLEAEGTGCAAPRTGSTASGMALGGDVNLVILDRMLPGRDGIEVLAAIRGLSRSCR